LVAVLNTLLAELVTLASDEETLATDEEIEEATLAEEEAMEEETLAADDAEDETEAHRSVKAMEHVQRTLTAGALRLLELQCRSLVRRGTLRLQA
jgi:hypothetical protein